MPTEEKRMITKKKVRDVALDVGVLLLAGVLFGIGYNMFLLPGKVFIGGAGGVAEVLNFSFGWPTGLVIFLINVPLVVLFGIFYGWRYSLKSLIGIVATSGSIDLIGLMNILPEAFPDPESNALFCAIFGGCSIGAAIGVLMCRGFTTGGSDLVAFLIRLKVKKLSTAKLIAVVDAVVIVTAAIVTGKFISVLYSLVLIFSSSTTLEIVTSGIEKNKMAFIFSNEYEKIADIVSTKMGRGVTLFNGEGWYTKDEKHVVFCVVKKSELFLLKSIARSVDPAAFIVLGDATETIGQGFKSGLNDVEIEPRSPHKTTEKQ